MAPINKSQIQRIYALGAGIGIVDSGNKDDNLHSLVYKLTGKKSVSKLEESEFITVERELLRLMRYENRTEPLKSRRTPSEPWGRIQPPVSSIDRKNDPNAEGVPGMMTKAQQSLAWRFIYRLIELDDGDKSKSGKRMVGAIKKILDIDAAIEEPFRWVNFEAGAKLIEQLKRYVRAAEKKKVAG
jgi:hypothetical protein